MTTVSLQKPLGETRPGPFLSPGGWGLVALLTLTFGLLHYVFLRRTWIFATTDSDWSHALIIPLISLYYIRIHQQNIFRAMPRVSPFGLLIMLAGFIGYGLGIYPIRNDMAQGYSMILALFGLVWFIMGPSAMRWLWFPVAYLVFAVKVSDRIWEIIANFLQGIAANAAVVVLECWAVLDPNLQSVNNRGITIDLTFFNSAGLVVTESINVAEACSGLRMLMAFIALGVAFAFIQNLRWWQRITLISLTIPIAVLVNVARVSVIGVLYIYNKDMATGDFHVFVGMLMLIPAAILFMIVTWILDNLVVTEDDEGKPKSARASVEQITLSEQAAVPTDWASPARIVTALLAGVGVTALAGLAYFSLLASARPDVISESFPAWAGVAGLVVSVLLLLVAILKVLPGFFRSLPEGLVGGTARQLAILVVIGGVVTATAGLNRAVAFTETVLFKEAVPLRTPIPQIPFTIGPWIKVHDTVLPKDVVDELGTEQYVSRIYVNTDLHPNPGINIRNEREVADYLAEAPLGSVVRLHVAYYTGTVDTVPHVPETCFVAGGLVPRPGSGFPVINLDPSRLTEEPEHGVFLGTATVNGQPTQVRIPEASFPMRQFTFGSELDPTRDMHVLYVFAANGEFATTAEEVRLQAFNATDRYSYYCKIEIQPLGVADHDAVIETVENAMNDMLPQIMAALPDWVEVTEGRWPLESD
ncbi:exosortase/archaeosortase family protein [Mucisphaera sp.]|uniref:exosortase/archaeosortase family protein n=1 Tax=Mucisphaera sp. TaxID=2913024 RepID=UPI003D10DC05